MTRPGGIAFKDLRWLEPDEARLAQEQNEQILAPFSDRVKFRCGGTKPYAGELSPGCVACCEGRWSCIFMTPRCTASCPTCSQNPRTKESRPPIAEGVEFERADDYVDYLDRFGYRAVGLCGGEPFLVYERLLSFVDRIKGRLGDRVYAYVYTNGDLITPDKLRALHEAGLDEIRVNLSARNYQLEPLEIATSICRRVTVEVPAIPEDFESLRDRLADLVSIGVTNLNLHQLFTTRFNYDRFVERNYAAQFRNSFDQLHLPGIGILESETTARKLIRHILENDLDLSVNYCSQEYKNFYQVRGFKNRPAELAREPFETVTDSGFIRRLSVLGDISALEAISSRLDGISGARGQWCLDRETGELHLHESLLEHVDFEALGLGATYYVCSPDNRSAPSGDFREIELSSDRSVFVERKRVGQFQISTAAGVKRYRTLCLDKQPGTRIEAHLLLAKDLEDRQGKRPSMSGRANFIAAESWQDRIPTAGKSKSS